MIIGDAIRKRKIRNMKRKIYLFNQCLMDKDKFIASFQGWWAYAKWANIYNLRKNIINDLNRVFV